MDERTRERFEAKVDRSEGPDACHPWRAGKAGPYGLFWTGERQRLAHIVALEEHLGRPLADGKQANHRCDNPPCVNPRHLYEGTQKQNREDAVARGRTARGERQGSAKLTAAAVADIRTGALSRREYADRYGVSVSAVSRARWKSWSYL